ncbi:MAG: amidophosphoribosyltransferase [Thermoplasmata archaeon HGW-Thermoplasmata-1]|nr:MAG: amidophosphoribosyltransferase [Thermoplasmata archaeon HGW-Thermoplasmata-1]
MKEACGVAAIATREKAASYLRLILNGVQHRGQEAAGIAFFDEEKKKIEHIKGLGLVESVFSGIDLETICACNGIGHVYYTINLSTPGNAQPHLIRTTEGDLAIAHNGIITNSAKLRDDLMRRGHVYSAAATEEESMAYLLAEGFKESGSIIKALKHLARQVEGSYALVMMFEDRVFALRDPLGLKPLCIGKMQNGGGYAVASESTGLDIMGAELIRDVAPGEAVELTADGFKSHVIADEKHKGYCFFEHVYFARSDSIMDGREVYESRKRIGWRLSKEHPVEADVVVPVPDSGRAHAYGFSLGSGIKIEEGLMKNRYVTRTFIMPTQKLRETSVRLKLNPVKGVIAGKRVVLVDDSIIRGTTMRKIVAMVRQAGAAEVHVRIGSPPVCAPCYLGIDMTDREQLIAGSRSVEEIRLEIGADSLGYISIGGLVEALGFDGKDLCLGCVTAEYPVNIPGEKHRHQKSIYNF